MVMADVFIAAVSPMVMAVGGGAVAPAMIESSNDMSSERLGNTGGARPTVMPTCAVPGGMKKRCAAAMAAARLSSCLRCTHATCSGCSGGGSSERRL